VLAARARMLLVWRGVQAERRAVLPPVLVVVAAVAVPIALALGGLDYVVGRNLIAACAPAAIVLAAGFCVARAGRWGLVGAIGLCGLFAFTTLSVVATPRFQRDDWRGAARSLGPAHDERALVVVPWVAPQPFSPYLPSL